VVFSTVAAVKNAQRHSFLQLSLSHGLDFVQLSNDVYHYANDSQVMAWSTLCVNCEVLCYCI